MFCETLTFMGMLLWHRRPTLTFANQMDPFITKGDGNGPLHHGNWFFFNTIMFLIPEQFLQRVQGNDLACKFLDFHSDYL